MESKWMEYISNYSDYLRCHLYFSLGTKRITLAFHWNSTRPKVSLWLGWNSAVLKNLPMQANWSSHKTIYKN